MTASLSIEAEALMGPLGVADFGARLSFDQGVRLFDPERLHQAGAYADALRRQRFGDQTFYNINRHINYSNVCACACRFCAFNAPVGGPSAWTMTLDEIFDIAANDLDGGVTELHIVGGVHPDLPFAYYEDMLRGLRAIRPDIHIKAFSAVEIQFFAVRFALTVAETLERLRAAGLDSLPGGGAEIFADRVRRRLCPDKATAAQWLDVHRQAHRLGIPSNATILYGHIETAEERVDHLMRLRDLQDETGGFQAIIPLKFQPENTALIDTPRSGGLVDLQMTAACRIILDNVDHVKAYWPSLGLKSAQIALSWGADDFDGTVTQERIYQAAGGAGPRGLDVEALVGLIEEVGQTAVERDSLYAIRPRRRAGRGN